MGKASQKPAQALLWIYKAIVSPLLHAVGGGACRFQPTCSEYAALALAVHGPMRGSWMALGRLLRCHPFSRGGFDPVPGTGYDPAPPRNVMHLP